MHLPWTGGATGARYCCICAASHDPSLPQHDSQLHWVFPLPVAGVFPGTWEHCRAKDWQSRQVAGCSPIHPSGMCTGGDDGPLCAPYKVQIQRMDMGVVKLVWPQGICHNFMCSYVKIFLWGFYFVAKIFLFSKSSSMIKLIRIQFAWIMSQLDIVNLTDGQNVEND